MKSVDGAHIFIRFCPFGYLLTFSMCSSLAADKIGPLLIYLASSWLSFLRNNYLSLLLGFIFFYFYWNIVDLQCCVSFRYTAK